MKKPQELRQYLINSVPALQHNPEQMLIFIDGGHLATTLECSLHFQYVYTLNVIITDLALHPDSILVPLLAWLRVNQTDIKQDGIKFKADVLNNDQIDLSLHIPITESVLVHTTPEGNYTTEHKPEPQLEHHLPEPGLFKALFANQALMTAGYEPE